MASLNFKGYIFDLDGTLLNSAGLWSRVDNEFLSRRGLEVPSDYAAKIAVMGFSEAAKYTIKRFGLSETPEEITAEWDELSISLFENEAELNDGAYEYLHMLKEQGRRLGVATASHTGLLTPALKRCGVYDLFDSVTTIYEVERGKSFPDIYIRAADKLGAKASECVVFEDALVAVSAAKSGGFYTVAVLSEENKNDHDALRKISDKTIESFGELL